MRARIPRAIRSVLARLIPLATLLALAVLVSVLGSTILPPRGVALSLVVAGMLVAVVLWRGLVKVHARLQAALRDTIAKPRSRPRPDGDSPVPWRNLLRADAVVAPASVAKTRRRPHNAGPASSAEARPAPPAYSIRGSFE